TASFASAPFMPTSSAFRCSQPNRSGKYAAFSFSGVMTPRCGNVGGTGFVCASAGAITAAASTNGSARLSIGYLLAKLQYSAGTGPLPMRTRLVATVAFAIAASAASAVTLSDVAASAAAQLVPLAELLDKAGWYLDYFVDEFENVVAEETYIQDSAQALPSFSPFTAGGRGGAFVPPTSASDTARARHRELRSDFLLAKSPATEALVPFPDVLEVDGIPVHDREARLAKLFVCAPDNLMEQAEKIGAEGARYNLGNMRSTLGNPVLALGVLQQSYQARFKFTLGKDDRSMGAGVTTIDYKEIAMPAM